MNRPARTVRTGLLAAGGVALAYYAPSTVILPTFAIRPPRVLPGLCRWRAQTSHGQMALTFDDGPSDDTPATLDVLETLGLRATFFVLGRQLEAFPEMGRAMVERGHEVASHGYDHFHHLLARPSAISPDVHRAVEVHQTVLGEAPRFYRPTYGQLCSATLSAARRHGLEVILWSRWGKEFAETEPQAVRRRLEPGLVPGAIVLLHDNDVSCRPGTGALTRRVLPSLADDLAERGLRAVTVGELLRGERAGA
jgi:peptidoglycan/xylan/chitin deacetylase (PgdA/CDA1 family)